MTQCELSVSGTHLSVLLFQHLLLLGGALVVKLAVSGLHIHLASLHSWDGDRVICTGEVGGGGGGERGYVHMQRVVGA